MGNLESAAKVNIGQLDGSCSRELDLSRSLTYEQYQKVSQNYKYLIALMCLLVNEKQCLCGDC
jgi:hypothetical protein